MKRPDILGKPLPKPNSFTFPPIQLWGLAIVLSLLFLMGGSSRPDVQSLAILNPAMVLCCGAALLTFGPGHWNDNKRVILSFSLFFLITAFYLIPSPLVSKIISPAGTNLFSIRAVADAPDTSAVLSIMPTATQQSLFFLFAPLAVFLFAMQLRRDDSMRALPVLIIAGTVSGVIGVLQLAGSTKGPLYLYQITNNGSAVGLFANRNHSAALLACLFPMLAIFATRSRGTRSDSNNMPQQIAMSVAIFLVPLILVTGSRAGMLAGIIGMIGGAVLYGSQISTNNLNKKDRSWTYILAASVVLCLVFATIYLSRAEAIDRLFAGDIANSRAGFWNSSVKLFWIYFPFGFGPGSFVPAFQKEEPIALLSHSYLNRFHNDWLETGLAFGVPGILLMLSGVVFYVRRSFLLWFRMDGRRSAVVLGRMASIIIAILGIASMSDYPLRTPAMMGFAALMLLWFVGDRRELTDTAEN